MFLADRNMQLLNFINSTCDMGILYRGPLLMGILSHKKYEMKLFNLFTEYRVIAIGES